MVITDYMKLARVQSTPLVVCVLLLGYGTVEGTIITWDGLYLTIMGSLIHWGVYSMNELEDMEHDREAGKEDKPLVNGSVSEGMARVFCDACLIIAVGISLLSFSPSTTILVVVVLYTSSRYNQVSKEFWLSSIYLSLAAVGAVYIGSSVATGSPNILTHLVALVMALQMLFMTIEGDLKDLDQPEDNIPKRMGLEIVSTGEHKYVDSNESFIYLFMGLACIQVLILASIAARGGLELFISSLPVVFGSLIFALNQVIPRYQGAIEEYEGKYSYPYSPQSIKRDIVIYTSLFAISLAIVSMAFLGTISASVLIVVPVTWGILVQSILYDSPTQFA